MAYNSMKIRLRHKEREFDNLFDKFAVKLTNGEEMVGHLPHGYSKWVAIVDTKKLCDTMEIPCPGTFTCSRKAMLNQLRWLNTVFARALANAIQRMHKYCIKKNMASIQWSFYLLNVRAICTIFLHKWTQCIHGFTLVLQMYVIRK